MWKKMQTNCIFIASNFVIRPQIWIFSVSKIASCLPYWWQIKFSMSLFFYLFIFAINLRQWKFVTADVTAVFVNNQHGIQWRGHDFDENTQVHSEYSYTHRGIKIAALKMQFVCIFFHNCWISAEIWIFNFPRKCSNVPKVRWVVSYRFCNKFHTLNSTAKTLKIG